MRRTALSSACGYCISVHKYLSAGAHLQAQIVTRRYVAQRHLRGQQLPRQLVHLLQHLRAVHQVMQQVAGNLRTQLHVSKRISLELCSVCTEVSVGAADA